MKIVVQAFDGITLFHLSTPLLVFGEIAKLGLANGWVAEVFTETGEAARSAEGYLVGEVSGPEVMQTADIIVLPSWKSALPEPSAALLQQVQQAHARGAMIVRLCLGLIQWLAAAYWMAARPSRTGRWPRPLRLVNPP